MLTKLKPTIAIVDSGIGGVAVLNKLIAKFKAGNYIYFADNLNMPYGSMSKPALKKQLNKIFSFLAAYNVDYIIVACNTASSVLQNKTPPNVEIMRFNENDTYLATPLTKNSLKNCNVIADPSLAGLIEKYIFEKKNLEKVVTEHIKKYKLNKLKSFVLACTHFELVEDIFKKVCPKSKIECNSEHIVNNLNIDFLQSDINLHIILSKPDLSYYKKLQNLIIK